MFKLRQEQMEAFRPMVRARVPHRILADLRKQGVPAERDPKTGEVVATDPRGFKTRLGFYPDGLPARLTQPSGSTYHFEHDREGRLAALTYPGGERLEMERDRRGNIAELRRPGLLSYQMEHDEGDRLLSVRYPDGTTARLAYHPEGPLESLTDRTGAVTRYKRTPEGKLQAIVDPLGGETVYKTDEDGKLAAVVFPDGSRQEYGFDPEARVAAVTTRDGNVVLQEFDDQDRIKAITWGDGSRTEFEFDEAGNLIKARNAKGEISFTYDRQGNPLTETTEAGTVQYTYDYEGRLTCLVTPFGDSIQYEYDADGRLTVVRDWEGRENRLVYAADGTIAEIHYGNGLIEKQRYARVGRLEHAVVVDPQGKVVSEQHYEYDANERLTGIADRWGDRPSQRSARRFEYDAESRITAEIDVESKRATARYVYDAKGNLIEDNGTPIEVGSMDEPRRYGNSPIEYDEMGNMTRLPGPKGEILCAYNADGTMREARIGGNAVHFEYDALGRRISKADGLTTWRYGWAGLQLLWDSSYTSTCEGQRRDYIYFGGSIAPMEARDSSETIWFQTDARVSVISVFNQVGDVRWRASYESCGSAQPSVAAVRQPWRLLGQYEDEEFGLCYNFSRYACPWLKSFTSRDPYWCKPRARNYSLVGFNFWNEVDPFGAIVQLLGAMAVGAVIGAVGGAIVGAAVGAGVAMWKGEDVAKGALKGAKDGALTGAVAGAIFPIAAAALGLLAPAAAAALAAGTLSAGAIVLGGLASGLSVFGGSLFRQWFNSEEICFSCAALEGAIASLLFAPLYILAALAPAIARSILGKNGVKEISSGNSRSQLIKELASQGIKHSPDDIVHIGRNAAGRIVFLEKGNSRAGLEHIMRHATDFEAVGIGKSEIPNLVFAAATRGRVVDMQRSRPVYEVVYDGEVRRVAVDIGSNGFIVGANPVGR